MWIGSLYIYGKQKYVCKHKHTYRGIFTWNHGPRGDIYTLKKVFAYKYIFFSVLRWRMQKIFLMCFIAVADMYLILISKIYEFQGTQSQVSAFVTSLLDYI